MDYFRKYFQVCKMSWQNTFVYRLNFVMWRLRTVILRLGAYFFWYAAYRFNKQIGVYDEKMMLTYILTSSFLHSLILTSKSATVSEDIANGGLNNHLLRPMKYFKRMIFFDLGDKVSNLFFLFFELLAIFLILKPPFFIQTNIFYLFSFLAISLFGVFIYFYLSLIISLTAFWYPEHNGWPARFLFTIVNRFLSGSVIPLDIFPFMFFNIFRFLPTAYFMYFPLQIYLGRVSINEILYGFGIVAFWIIFLKFLVNVIWQKGLKNYSAVGI